VSRRYCPCCAYPARTCLCDAINETRYQTRVVILQHPDEARHAKNTARLIGLVNPETELVIGESAEDFARIRAHYADDSRAVVLYPAPESTALGKTADSAPVETIIIIDGTWRKAKKIWLTNEWLQSMRVCHLNDLNESAYNIRSSRVTGGMASIEAVAHALALLEDTSTEPLWTAFMAMQEQWPESGKGGG